MSFTEGTVIIEASSPCPGVTEVHTRSTRAGEVAQALIGQTADSPLAVTLIESLYALCPQAHLAAWKGAVTCALGGTAQFNTRRIVYEIMSEHLRFLAFDAPNSVGMRPDGEVRRLGTLRALLAREFSGSAPDYDAIDRELEPLLEYFVTGCPLAHFKALESLPDFEAWMMRGATAAARLFAQLWENVPCRKRTPVAHLPVSATVEEIESWFAAGISMREPAVLGQPRQTSAESRRWDFPLLAEINEQYGCGVRASFAARLIDLMSYWSEREHPVGVAFAGSPSAGVGIATVQCARGMLTTRVRVVDGILAQVQVLAPTEWNFAPKGAAEVALSMIELKSEAQFRGDASWVIAAVDPCVPYLIKFPNPKG